MRPHPLLLLLLATGARAEVFTLRPEAQPEEKSAPAASPAPRAAEPALPAGRLLIGKGGAVQAGAGTAAPALPVQAPAGGGNPLIRLASARESSGEQPREFEGTYTQLAALDRSREAVRAAEARSAQARRAVPQLEARRTALEKELAEKNTLLQGLNPRASKTRYNAAVADVNATRAELEKVTLALAAETRALRAGEEAAVTYRGRLEQFEADFAARKAVYLKAHRPEDAAEYFDKIAARLAKHHETMRTDKVPFERSGEHLVFSVTASGKGPVKLMLDTGATYVVMNEDAARRLGLPVRGAKTSLTLGNGERMEGQVVTAPELRVGQSRARNVEVVVTAVTDKMDGMDGVIGMSFLRFFAMNYDPAAGIFTLKGLDADAL